MRIKGNFKSPLKRGVQGCVAFLLMFVLLAFAATQAHATYAVKQQWVRISLTAGETLTKGQMVAIKAADGYAYKADADVSTLRPAIGIVGTGAAAGASVEVIVEGIVTGWTSQTIGAPGYLSETAGAVTQSAPTYNQQVGIAISATTYYINCKNYLDTTGLLTQTGSGSYKSYTLSTDNVTLTSADCGKVYAIATDAKVFSLPATAAGCEFTFINAGANDHNIVAIDPTTNDQIFGDCGAVVIAGATGEKLQNTKTGSKRGDSVKIVGDGVDGWYITSCNGVWAEETP
jgi:hypothetical protein